MQISDAQAGDKAEQTTPDADLPPEFDGADPSMSGEAPAQRLGLSAAGA